VSTRKKIWSSSWRVLLCVVLLGWIFHTIFLKEARSSLGAKLWDTYSYSEQARAAWIHGPPKLWSTLTLISPGALALSVVLMGLTILLGIARWRMVLRVHGLELSWSRTAEISFVAHFFNSFLLGSTGGDLMKAYYAARETHHKKTEAVVTVFVDRLVGLWAMLLFAGLMMLPQSNLALLFVHSHLRSLAALILAMLAACSGVVAVAFWGGVSRGWSGAREWLRRLPKGEWLERSLESCRTFGRERLFVTRTLGFSMVLNAVCVLQVLVLAWGLHLHIPPLVLFVTVPMIICISALPITPSGLGVRENLFVFMLAQSSIGVPATSALSLSLLAYAGSLFWSLVGGLVYAMFKERHHLKEAELEQPENGVLGTIDAAR
jgi:uncharacterized protein (TIRG00374 family)